MGWYEAIKDAVEAAGKFRDAAMTEMLATVRMEGAKLAEDNAQLREERNSLREQLDVRRSMVFD